MNAVIASNLDRNITKNLRRSLRRVRSALLLFSVPWGWSLVGLYFQSNLPTSVPQLPAILEILAAITMIGFVTATLVGWTVTRGANHRLQLALRECGNQLNLARLELETSRAQHMLEMRLKQQELNHAVAIRKARLKIEGLDKVRLQNEQSLEHQEPDQDSRVTEQ